MGIGSVGKSTIWNRFTYPIGSIGFVLNNVLASGTIAKIVTVLAVQKCI
jgi:hypothetical protein